MSTAKNASKRSATSTANATLLSTRKETASSVSSARAEVDAETGEDIRRATLDEILAMKDGGELYYNPDAPEGPDLPDSFWENAVWEGPRRTRPVHLKLDADVFAYFVQETGGKGHITRMQAVLKSYVRAQKAAADKRLPKG